MSFFFFFQNRRPIPFEHKPIYYDSKKDLNKPVSNKELNSIRGRFIQETSHLKKRKKTNRTFYRFMLLLIIIVLGLIILFQKQIVTLLLNFNA
jgi:hypothetical protein